MIHSLTHSLIDSEHFLTYGAIRRKWIFRWSHLSDIVQYKL